MVVSALTAAMSVQSLSPAHAAALRTLAAAAARGGDFWLQLDFGKTPVAPLPRREGQGLRHMR